MIFRFGLTSFIASSIFLAVFCFPPEKAAFAQGDNRVADDTVNKEVLPDEKFLENAAIEANDNNVVEEVPTTQKMTTTEAPHEHPVAAHHVAPKGKGNVQHESKIESMSSLVFTTIVIGCSIAGITGLVVAGVCWYRLHKSAKESSEVDYPAYGVTGPNKNRSVSPGDRKLAESAQMYHYQHQKQQMMALERANSEMNNADSDNESEDDNEEDHVTVYECPGLAPTGEMEVRNPLFKEDMTPTPGESSTYRKQ